MRYVAFLLEMVFYTQLSGMVLRELIYLLTLAH